MKELGRKKFKPLYEQKSPAAELLLSDIKEYRVFFSFKLFF